MKEGRRHQSEKGPFFGHAPTVGGRTIYFLLDFCCILCKIRETMYNERSSYNEVSHMVPLQTPEEVLLPLKPNVENGRCLFLSELNTLPQPFAEVAREHYLERANRAGDSPLLGEYAPWIIGDSLGASPDTINSVLVPWMLLYEHVLTIDDAIDNPSRVHPKHMILNSLLFQRSMLRYREAFPDQSDFWLAFQDHYEANASAGFRETEVFHNSYSELNQNQEDHAILAQKSAILKICATALSLKTQQRGLGIQEDEAIDDMLTGIQLLDDLTDWEEDIAARNFTYPLNQALTWLAGVRGVTVAEVMNADSDSIFLSLILSGATTSTVARANSYLTRVAMNLPDNGDAIAHKYFNSLTERNSIIADSIKELVIDIPELTKGKLVETIHEGRKPAILLDKIWPRLQANFRVLAQSS